MTNPENKVSTLFSQWSGEEPLSVTQLAGSGSWRKYYRIKGRKHQAIGVFNEDLKENNAFISFTNHFRKLDLPVPELYLAGDPATAYLLSDLGDETLFSFLSSHRKNSEEIPDEALDIYEQVIRWLPKFQVEGGKDIDYSVCYPRSEFDRQSMMWDLNYFKYYFLKLARIPFDEQHLEDDFNRLTEILLKPRHDYFMYRDFQSRNIMLSGNKTYFIDYQGGRRGPLQYDIASLLYDAKAAIPEDIRERLLDLYIREAAKYTKINEAEFRQSFWGFVLIRIFQALGAYGFRGYYENKPHFLQSIPYAVANLESLLEKKRIPEDIPTLTGVIEKILLNKSLRQIAVPAGNLTVTIFSFSYKDQIPADETGNGGGYVFDCRSLPNPGRLEEYRPFTGKDLPVIEFLKKEPAVDEFLIPVFSLVDQAVTRYLERDFTNLMVSFGCTGGQHRSVYCAEQLAAHLKEKFPVKIKVIHTTEK